MFTAGQDRKGRWGVFDTRARVWYYVTKPGNKAELAREWARALNEED